MPTPEPLLRVQARGPQRHLWDRSIKTSRRVAPTAMLVFSTRRPSQMAYPQRMPFSQGPQQGCHLAASPSAQHFRTSGQLPVAGQSSRYGTCGLCVAHMVRKIHVPMH